MNEILDKQLTETKLKLQPHKVLCGAVFLTLAISYVYKDKSIDIQLHDTYFVTDALFIGKLCSFILGVVGSIYYLVRKRKLVSWMTYLHVFLTIFSIGFVYYNLTLKLQNYADLEKTIRDSLLVIFLGILSQLLFIVNLVMSKSEK
jgi:hypothetical protein